MALNYDIHTLEAKDYHKLLPYFKMRYSHTCENILISHFMWKDYYQTRYICDEGGLIWLMDIDGEVSTMTPLCRPEDLPRYFEIARRYFNEVLNTKMTLYLADREALDLIAPDPAVFKVTADRRYFDYVYDAQKLMTFSGKAYHKKKNHVNAFKKAYEGRYEYRSLACGCHHKEIMDFLYEWEEERQIKDDYNRVDYELKGIETVLSNCGYLDYHLGGIYIDGKLEAFSLGVYGKAERTAYIEVEKANPEIRGLYPMICSQFLQHEFPEALYVNREDDMGLEGLRKSKMSYQPITLVEKYEIRQF